MMDLVSYERKHNEANGENNRDGENFNHSWNCGVEGKSRKKKIVALRQKQMKNAFMLLFFSQGTPLILAGDEFENTQGGNNNPYCIDDEISWLNWKAASTAGEMYKFVKELIQFRDEHKILHRPKPLMACDQRSCGYPDVSYHGSSAWYNAMEPFNRNIGIMYCSRYAQDDKTDKRDDELIYVAYNMHWEPHELALPKVAEGCIWKAVICSGDIKKDVIISENRMLSVEPRTTVILLGNIRQTAGLVTEKSENKIQKHRKTGN
jgi:glycogen operon protein